MLIAARRVQPKRLLLMLALLLPGAMFVSLMVGPVVISPGELIDLLKRDAASVLTTDSLILFNIRLPRLLLGAFIGLNLAICGAAMQGLFRNPLADPSLIGVTSGASAGASCVIVLGGGWLAGLPVVGLPLIATGATIGGLLAVTLVYRISTSATGTSVHSMLLAGIAISALAASLNSLFSYVADNDMLRRISLWQMGSLDGASWAQVSLSGGVALLLLFALPRHGAALNALLLGESEARHLGIGIQGLKRWLVAVTALGVGSAVALSGVIAFVGLLVPHFVRLLIGPDHRYVLPASALAGAILLVAADSVARVIVAPAELPTGILTALLGAPLFFFLLAERPASGVN